MQKGIPQSMHLEAWSRMSRTGKLLVHLVPVEDPEAEADRRDGVMAPVLEEPLDVTHARPP